ncbi:MAG: restriction endonuclease subunit S [Candidatus Marsarchaeota archaeon]|nr:restriction endonuclease subunit S [Candidatus Marsarchaeota archaeon]
MEESENRHVPASWATATAHDVCHVERGITFPASVKSRQAGAGMIACLRTTNVQEIVTWDDLLFVPVSYVRSNDKLLRKNDILISMANSRELVGKVAFVESVRVASTFGGFIAAIRASTDIIQAKYLFYYFRTEQAQKELRASSSQTVNIANISLGGIYSLPVPVAPSAEQVRIVAELDKQLSRLDEGVSTLCRAQANLKRYRASVLKVACEGRLVPQDPNDEPASELLKRILAERRAKWEAEQLAKMLSEGRGARNEDWRKAYKTPSSPQTAHLPRLPQGWCWTVLQQLAEATKGSITDGPFGSNLKTAHYVEHGPRVIRLQNIGDGEFIDEKAHIREGHFEKLRKHEVLPGDLVIAGLGETLPRACLIPSSIGPAIVKADCFRFRPDLSLVVPGFLVAVLNSETIRRIASTIIHGIGRPRLNLQDVKSLPIPLPPKDEQARIADEVELRLTIVAVAELAVASNMTRGDKLRQGILKRAFEGKLVPQDPNHEPASVLLERVRAECRSCHKTERSQHAIQERLPTLRD